MAKPVVRFDTSEFQKSHMRAPRGRGSWAFSSKRDPYAGATVGEAEAATLWSPSMTYGEAKQWAKAQMVKSHAGMCPVDCTLFVLP